MTSTTFRLFQLIFNWWFKRGEKKQNETWIDPWVFLKIRLTSLKQKNWRRHRWRPWSSSTWRGSFGFWRSDSSLAVASSSTSWCSSERNLCRGKYGSKMKKTTSRFQTSAPSRSTTGLEEGHSETVGSVAISWPVDKRKTFRLKRASLVVSCRFSRSRRRKWNQWSFVSFRKARSFLQHL